MAVILPGATLGLRRGELSAAAAPTRPVGPRASANARALSDAYFGLSMPKGGDGRFRLVPLSTTAEPEVSEPDALEATSKPDVWSQRFRLVPTDAPDVSEPDASEDRSESIAHEQDPAEEEDPEEDPAAEGHDSERAGQEEGVAWRVEPQPYYSWMWGDAAIRPAPLDLGHGGADPEPTRWSPWLGRRAAIEDLQLYRTADNLNRPVEMRIAAAAGQLPKDEVEGKLLPGSERFLSRFASIDEAIDYLSRGGAVLRRKWQEAEEQSASQAASMPIFNATGERSQEIGGEQAGEEGAPEEKPYGRSDARLGAPAPPAGPSPPPHMKPWTAEGREDGGGDSGASVGTWVGYLGYLGFVPCLACIGWLAFRLLCKRNCRDIDIVTSAGEEESSDSSGEDDTETESGGPNPWQAFMGAPRDAEMRKLLLFPEKNTPQELPPLPDDDRKAPPNPAQRPAAEAEVERILSTREQRNIFGPGDAIARKQEFRRLLLLLHPDKGLVSGERATLALRRVVEAYRALAAEP